MSGYVVCVTFDIDPAAISQFMVAMMAQAKNSLTREEGCSQFDVCVDLENPARIFLYEIYDDRAAFDIHLASAHFRDFDAQTREWVQNKQATMWQRKQGVSQP